MRIKQTAAWSIPVLTFTLMGFYAQHTSHPVEDTAYVDELLYSEDLFLSAEAAGIPSDLTVLKTRTAQLGPINPVSYLPSVSPNEIDAETLWLARCIYSESKRPAEQELVAWVVRNRVETGYRNKSSYKDTVLDPYQFSAFNANYPKRKFYVSLNVHSSDVRGWKTALQIAHYVRHARSEIRPFPRTTRHFYSERSMKASSRHPEWAVGRQPVRPNRSYKIDAERFRFFEGIS